MRRSQWHPSVVSLCSCVPLLFCRLLVTLVVPTVTPFRNEDPTKEGTSERNGNSEVTKDFQLLPPYIFSLTLPSSLSSRLIPFGGTE